MVQRITLQGQSKYQDLACRSFNTDILTSNPSVPPANGACRLTALPTELLRLVTAKLDPIGYRGVRLSSKSLRGQLDAPPPMTLREYAEFQKQLEAHSSRNLKTLFCSFCNHFKARTPSRNTFTDAQAVQDHSGRRACIECGVNNGHYDKRDVVIKKKKFFACGGCKHVLPHDEEDKVVADVVTTKGYPYRDSAFGQGAEITFGSGGKRWCRRCRASLQNLGGSGAMKLKQVYMPH